MNEIKSLKVLVVEDDLDVNEFMSEELEDQGHQVTSAFDGEEALIWMQKEKFDFIITDLMMPRLDGFSMVAAMNQNEIDIPVIMVTGSSIPDLNKRAKELGILSVIQKPPTFDVIKNRLNQAATIRKHQERSKIHAVK